MVTVCDRAAKEVCPVWFGKSVSVHWGLVDPSKVTESEERIAEAFRTTISEIIKRATAISIGYSGIESILIVSKNCVPGFRHHGQFLGHECIHNSTVGTS